MKKLIPLLFIACGAVSLWAQTAVIREMSGTVEVKAPGSVEWTAAVVGQNIDNATVISTGFKSTALISLGNSAITVHPLTRLTLETLREVQNTQEVELYLQTGRVKADVHPPSGGKVDFTVWSPTITASVRGTSFEFDGLRLSVAEGRVHVSGNDGTGVYVGAGNAVVGNAETGRTATAAETAREGLVPSTPAGIDRFPVTPFTIPATGSFTVDAKWE
jgi:hypothetical protein